MVDPSEPAPSQMEQIKKSLPVLPREEAYKVRRMARSAADVMLPWALQEMKALYDATPDDELRFKILNRIVNISLSNRANEDIDPEAPTVEGKVVAEGDPLLKLERETEKSGTPGVE